MNTETRTPPDHPLSEKLKHLQNALGWIDYFNKPSRGDFMTLVVLRQDHIVLKIDGAANHGRPHFHIEFKREHAASYAIDSFECLAGNMPRKYEDKMLEWAREHQGDLYEVWKKLHPGIEVFAVEQPGSEE